MPTQDITEVQILEEAIAIAEKVGAVKNGSHLAEIEGWENDYPPEYGTAAAALEEGTLCGVCIFGAYRLAEIVLGFAPGTHDCDTHDATGAELAARGIKAHPHYGHDGAVTSRITEFGTPYVLGVLRRMLDAAKAKAPA